MCDILQAVSEVLLRTDLGKQIVNTDSRYLSPVSRKTESVILGGPALKQLKINNDRIAQQTAKSLGSSFSSSSSSPSSSSFSVAGGGAPVSKSAAVTGADNGGA
jgi:hypothetical protein